jgi:hypothetical protein
LIAAPIKNPREPNSEFGLRKLLAGASIKKVGRNHQKKRRFNLEVRASSAEVRSIRVEREKTMKAVSRPPWLKRNGVEYLERRGIRWLESVIADRPPSICANQYQAASGDVDHCFQRYGPQAECGQNQRKDRHGKEQGETECTYSVHVLFCITPSSVFAIFRP